MIIKSFCFIRQATTPVKNQEFKDSPFVPELIVYSDKAAGGGES
jgi:hypothetical protein